VHPGFPVTLLGLMQIGPDGNIYFNEQVGVSFDTMNISVIRCPDGLNPTCQRPFLNFPVSPVFNYNTSLPNYADYIYAIQPPRDTSDQYFCSKNDELTIGTYHSGKKYLWSTGDTSATIKVKKTGIYTVDYQDACSFGTTVIRVADGTVTAKIVFPEKFDTCNPFPLTLRAVVTPGAVFHWDDGSTADTLVVHHFGQYGLEADWPLTHCGAAYATVLMPYKDCCHPHFPNVFTPNNDQLNDTFGPLFTGCDVESLSMEVYSRWGQLMFRNARTDEKWDGKNLNGSEAPSDVYAYTLRYKLAGLPETFMKGEVTLLR
jgi:gliding motility-associated-like protein